MGGQRNGVEHFEGQRRRRGGKTGVYVAIDVFPGRSFVYSPSSQLGMADKGHLSLPTADNGPARPRTGPKEAASVGRGSFSSCSRDVRPADPSSRISSDDRRDRHDQGRVFLAPFGRDDLIRPGHRVGEASRGPGGPRTQASLPIAPLSRPCGPIPHHP